MLEDEGAAQFLRVVGDWYAGLRTYRDHGRVTARGSLEADVQFRTLFIRDTGIRFSFLRGARVEVITKAASDPDQLFEALAQVTGVSAGAAHTIPALLLPAANQGNWSILQLAEPRLVRPPRGAPASARSWTWIAGTGWAGQPLRIAIDSSTLLVRRLEDDGRAGVRSATTEYEPEADIRIPPDDLMGAAPGTL